VIGQLRSAPNQLTLMRLVFVPFAAIAVLERHYGWALIIFIVAGLSDGLDGLLARALKQRTTLGQYLDPLADKLLLSTLFIVLSVMHKIPWRVTILVFTRDGFILLVAAVFYVTSSLRGFRPSIWGKVNTGVQILTVGVVLLYEVHPALWIAALRTLGDWSTMAFTVISGVHYVLRAGAEMRSGEAQKQIQNSKFKIQN